MKQNNGGRMVRWERWEEGTQWLQCAGVGQMEWMRELKDKDRGLSLRRRV